MYSVEWGCTFLYKKKKFGYVQISQLIVGFFFFFNERNPFNNIFSIYIKKKFIIIMLLLNAK